MKKIGLESEYFVALVDDLEENPVIIPSQFPTDESGILLEVRGKPGEPYFATYSFVQEYFHLQELLKELSLKIILTHRHKITKRMQLDLSRQFAKGIYKAQNLYSDVKTHRKSTAYYYAGLHVHFSNNFEHKMYTPDGQYSRMLTVPQIVDIPHIVRKMDEEYGDQISAYHRNKGCYELKGDNFEYRSLPTYFIESLEDIANLLALAKFAYGLIK